MDFLTEPVRVRCSVEVSNKLNELLERFPEDYPTKSSAFRAALILLHKWRIKKGEKVI